MQGFYPYNVLKKLSSLDSFSCASSWFDICFLHQYVMIIILARRLVACISLAVVINVAPLVLLEEKKLASALAQMELPNIPQSELQNTLNRLDELRISEIGEKDYYELYDIGLQYFALAELAGQLGFSGEQSSALFSAEIALSTILNNTGIFGFVRQNVPARSETYSSTNGSNFSFGWSWSSGSSQTSCSISGTFGQNSAALESSASRLLQQVYVEQGNFEAALLVAELGRSITVEKSVFQNAFSSSFGSNTGDLCKLAEDFAPRLTVADMQNLAASLNATIVNYSVISYDDDPYFLKYIRDVNWGTESLLGIVEFPSDIYIWVIEPSGNISFTKQPLSTLDLEALGLECKSSETCRPSDYGGLINVVASARETSVEKVRSSLNSEFGGFSTGSSSPDENKIYNELYELLISPIEGFLPSNPNARVIFIPQGPISFIPFAALRDSADPSGRYLIEKHTIITAPNLRHLRLSQQKRNELDNDLGNALVVGNPTLDLPFSEVEAEAVAQILEAQGFDIGELLIGLNADRQSVIDRMDNARIIHLASHGTLDIYSPDLPDADDILSDEKPSTFQELMEEAQNDILHQFGIGEPVDGTTPLGILFSLYRSPTAGGSIALSGSSDEQASLTANTILELDLSETELVVLSACNTGRGPLTPGGVVGLPFSLSIAGVPSIILSLWDVPDESTSELMVSFYQHLFDNQTQNPRQDKAIALRLAMLDFLEENPNALPGEWAAFTLVGSAD